MIQLLAPDGTRTPHDELDAALAREPASPEVALRRGLFFLNTGKLADAERETRRALDARPEDPRMLLARVRVLEERAQGAGSGVPADLVARLARKAITAEQLAN